VRLHSDDLIAWKLWPCNNCISPFIIVCVQSSLRIVGGVNNMTGRVEICHNNMWRTICDYGWGNVDAGVACRQIGFDQNC